MATVQKRTDSQGNIRWRVRWREGGRGTRHLSETFATQREARRRQREIETNLEGLSDPRAAHVTLAVWWQDWVDRQVWRPTTRQSVEYDWRRISPVLGRKQLGAISRGDIQRLIKILLDRYDPSTTRVTLQRLRGCLRAAVHDGILIRDPTMGVRVPDATQEGTSIPSPGDVQVLLEQADEMTQIAILLGAHAGLRRGELLGLTMDRIESAAIRVDRQTDKTAMADPMSWRAPKSRRSIRTIPVPTSLTAAVARLVDTTGLGESDVLMHVSGRALIPARFDERWRTLRSRTGVQVRFHDLRHFFCTSLLAAGVNVKAVADAAGHSSPVVTLRTYSHVMPGDEEAIRVALRTSIEATLPADRSRTGSDPD